MTWVSKKGPIGRTLQKNDQKNKYRWKYLRYRMFNESIYQHKHSQCHKYVIQERKGHKLYSKYKTNKIGSRLGWKRLPVIFQHTSILGS